MSYDPWTFLCNPLSLFFILYVCISFQAKQENISGDFRGDVYQNGGTLVIAPGLSYMLLFEKERGEGTAY